MRARAREQQERRQHQVDGAYGEAAWWARLAFWTLAIDSETTGRACPPSERKLLAAMASTMLVTLGMGALGMGFVLESQGAGWPVVLVGATAWAFVLLLIDRAILAVSMRGKSLKVLGMRLVFAGLMSVVVTTPLKLKLFEGLVEDHLAERRQTERAGRMASARAASDALVAGDSALVRLRAGVEAKRAALKIEQDRVASAQRAYEVRLAEALKENRTGCRQRCEEAKRQAEQYRARALAPALLALKAAQANEQQAERAYTDRLNKLNAEGAALVASTRSREQTLASGQRTDLIVRLRALLDLSAEDSAVRWISLLLLAIFITLETTPLLIKTGVRTSVEDRLTRELDLQLAANAADTLRVEELRRSARRNAVHDHVQVILHEHARAIDALNELYGMENMPADLLRELVQRSVAEKLAAALGLDPEALAERTANAPAEGWGGASEEAFWASFEQPLRATSDTLRN